jgi:hypothetical protein
MFAIGNIIKVVAVDSLTGIEVTMQGPATAGEAALRNAAARKLKYVLEKEQQKK